METIQSRYLKREFTFTPATMQRNDGPVTIIPHNELWDIIHNQIPCEIGIAYDYNPVAVTREHCFIGCTMHDTAGRLVTEFGESTAETLTSKIANRSIVMDGLKAINQGKAPEGLLALIEQLNLFDVDEGDVSFMIAPILNAAGRMLDDGAQLSFSLLTAVKGHAGIAEHLIKINKERKAAQLDGMTAVEDICM